jgi:hypothetical protein
MERERTELVNSTKNASKAKKQITNVDSGDKDYTPTGITEQINSMSMIQKSKYDNLKRKYCELKAETKKLRTENEHYKNIAHAGKLVEELKSVLASNISKKPPPPLPTLPMTQAQDSQAVTELDDSVVVASTSQTCNREMHKVKNIHCMNHTVVYSLDSAEQYTAYALLIHIHLDDIYRFSCLRMKEEPRISQVKTKIIQKFRLTQP